MSTPALIGSCGCGLAKTYHPSWAPIPGDGLPRLDEALPRSPAR